MATNYTEENSIMRPALGRDFKIGSLYTTLNDKFDISPYSVSANYQPKTDNKLFYNMLYGKTLGDKVKLLETHPEYEFIIKSCQSSSQNYFFNFLNEKNYKFGDQLFKRAAFKIELKTNKTSIDLKKENKLLSEIKKNNSAQNQLVVTEVTYGLQIIGVLWFINENKFTDNELENNFALILDGLCQKDFNFPNIKENVKKNVIFDFIDNIRQLSNYSVTFDKFIDNFIRLLNTKDYKPIEYKLTSIKNPLLTTDYADLNFVFKFYSNLNETISSLLDKWHEFNIYSNYYESSKKDAVKNALKDLHKFLDEVTLTLRKEVIAIRNYNKRGMLYYYIIYYK